MGLLVPPPSVLRPKLRGPLRHFVEAAFASLEADVDAGHEVPFAVEERRGDDGPALYAYRPLFARYVEERTVRLTGLAPYREAIDALLDDPGARTFAVVRAGAGLGEEASVRSALLWPLVAEVAERADGFAFAEDAFDTAYGGLERAVVETRHRFEAVVPLIGVLVTEPPVDLGAGIQLRRADAGELATGWPDAAALVPERFGTEPDRRCALELVAHLDREEVFATPDTARLTAAAVTALRLVSGGAIASGPVVFERLDLVPRAVRPMPPDVAVAPVGPAVRLDQHTLGLARTLCVELARSGVAADGLSVALSRWSSALATAGDAERAVAFLAALEPLLAPGCPGTTDVVALRAAALVGSSAGERTAVAASIREAALLPANAPVLPAIARRLADEVGGIARAILVAALGDERRGAELPLLLDDVLLGARPRPSLVPAGIALAPR